MIRWRSRFGCLIALLATVAPARGDDPPAKPPAALTLFDGRTLDGWKPSTGARAGKVEVKDDAIRLAAGEPMTSVTTTRTDLPKLDYRLTYQAKRTEGSDFFAAATFPVGPSFVTLVNGGWGGGVTGLSLINGASAVENETNHYLKYQNDVWYTFDIAVTHRAIRCQVDGKPVVTFPHEGAQLTTRIETRANQPLGFASYRSAGEIRRVSVQPLTPAEVAAIDAQLKLD